ncbi:hypothetical protein DY000_02034233 [Brassica cretica]|uniref:Uncharacterized protein n=1 Tax=Brassica cretica TaxID=69181 RepID=A0ABQ7DLM4_BRACR|nr:hypothetical protein DY000_02034233 [Brassica cretica]
MKNLAEKTHSRKIGERREQGCRIATSARYVATDLSPKLGRYVACTVATQRARCSVLGRYEACSAAT